MNSKLKIRTRYQKPLKISKSFSKPSKTQQNLKDETDINSIIKRYDKTGILSSVNEVQQQFGDFSDVPDYKTCIERVHSAGDAFLQLPSEVRKRFNNNALDFLEFAQNPENQKEMIKLGLAKKRNTDEPDASPAKPQVQEGEKEKDPSTESKG